MKSISLLALAAVSTACLFVGCSPAKDDDDSGSTGATGGTKGDGGTKNDGGTKSEGGGETTEGGGETTEGGAAMGGQPSQGGGTGTPISACGEGIVIEGDPLFNDKDVPGSAKPNGQGTLADPPVLPAEDVAVIGNKLFLNSEEEIWVADLDGANPTIKRLAGQRGAGKISAGDLPCKDTRFLVVHNMAATPDGKLVVVDYIGGAIVEITDPTGPDCTSHWVAGTSTETEDPGNDYPANHGDMDGPGNMALFGGDPDVTGTGGAGIHKIAVDPDGNYYTWDEGTGKIKMIATDADRTVSTIGHISPADDVRSLTFMNGRLYAITNDAGSEEALFEINPATYDSKDTTTPTKNIKEIYRADSEAAGNMFPELEGSGHIAALSDLQNDGEALIVSSALGFVWRMGTDGTVLATLAGSLSDRGTPGRLDFEGDFDPTISHPAAEWQLVTQPSSVIGAPWLEFKDGSLYWSGGIGVGEYVVKFDCQ